MFFSNQHSLKIVPVCFLVTTCAPVFNIALANAKPLKSSTSFHQQKIDFLEGDWYKLNEDIVQFLPQVVVHRPSSTVQSHPSLMEKIQPLGPTSSQSILISLTSIDEAIALATELSLKGESAWVDMKLAQKAREISFEDEHFGGQWYVEYLEMEQLWEHSLGDVDTIVAIIDSGIDIYHPDLINKVIAPYDAHDDDNDPSPNPGEYCWNSDTDICDEHGTAVAGITLAQANQTGIVGLCPECSLVPIKMLGDTMGELSADIAAFEHAIAQDAAVINNSWGFTEVVQVPQPLREVIARAATETRGGLGSVVVFAAGNDGREVQDGELCTLPEILCVSAIDSYGRPTAYTNFGDSIDVAAPSATVSIAPNDELTTNFGGTSAAAPVVSGIASWIVSVHPEMSAQEITDLIIDTAQQSPLITPDENGHHPSYGFGIISPLTIKEVFYPVIEETEEPKQGCSHIPITSLLLPLIVLYPRRRTC